MAQLFSDTWARAVGEQLSSSEAYQTAARTWEVRSFSAPSRSRQGIAEDVQCTLIYGTENVVLHVLLHQTILSTRRSLSVVTQQHGSRC
jgi:hypothetical protein